MIDKKIIEVLKGCDGKFLLGMGGYTYCGSKYHPSDTSLMYCEKCEGKIELLKDMGLITEKDLNSF